MGSHLDLGADFGGFIIGHKQAYMVSYSGTLI